MNLISAGGIVYQKDSSAIYIAVCGRKYPKTFNLPKGTPEIGETTEETALREVTEETGLKVRAIKYIDSINYWVTNHPDYEGQKLYKEVYYYLMEPTGGDFSKHDGEFDTVEWVDSFEIPDILTYENEVEIVQKGLSLV
ncbi:MAG: NUDIX hydrolase [Dehalococcoidia bacterium]|tara:strand:+ start:4849 stop:5265 length:417 start_codon:yes stop_codon:yes gene_type:complete